MYNTEYINRRFVDFKNLFKFWGYHSYITERETMNKRIARLRKENGMTQKELADKIGIASTLISDYERGKLRLYDELIIKMAEVFQISTDQVLGYNITVEEDQHPSRRVMKRLKVIQELSLSDQKKVLQNLDLIIQGIRSK